MNKTKRLIVINKYYLFFATISCLVIVTILILKIQKHPSRSTFENEHAYNTNQTFEKVTSQSEYTKPTKQYLDNNTNLPFTYSYPKGWNTNTPNCTLTKDDKTIEVCFYAFSFILYEGMSLDEYYKHIATKAKYDQSSEIIDRKNIIIDGIEGVLLTEVFNNRNSYIYIRYKEQIVRIIINPEYAIEDPDVKYILSSIKFIN